jgi:dihydrofolate reductase
MAATYTFDVFSTLDGYGSPGGGDWGGYWGKQGPELLDHRLALFTGEQRMVFGGETYRLFAHFFSALDANPEAADPWVGRMLGLPATVVSNTLAEPLAFPSATVTSGDAVDVVARLKQDSDIPLCSHGSLSLNRALLAAGLVDRIRVTVFPVITGGTGGEPIFRGAGDFDLELLQARTLDGDTQELTYAPTLHVSR